MIGTIDVQLTALNEKFQKEVDVFVSHYNTFVESAREKLNNLYNPMDYPNDIAQRFSFEWKYVSLGAPQAQLLSPEIYEREKQKFEQTMLEFRENAISLLRVSFAEMVDHIVERLSGEKKVFRDTLIGNIQEFLNDFNAMNINNDTDLSEQIERCRAILKGVNPDALRSNEGFRQHIANNMSGVQKNLDNMMIDRPTRKLRMRRIGEKAA